MKNPSTPNAVENAPKSRLRWLLLPLFLVAAGFACYLLRAKPASESKPENGIVVRTAKSENGPLAITMRLSGQTSARVFAAVTAPRLRGP